MTNSRQERLLTAEEARQHEGFLVWRRVTPPCAECVDHREHVYTRKRIIIPRLPTPNISNIEGLC